MSALVKAAVEEISLRFEKTVQEFVKCIGDAHIAQPSTWLVNF